jgi:mannose-1-phosphate guanylyltransferase/mannose-6-phosphate isomerase
VILSGGAGTRLWPISTPEHPKQFVELLGEPLFEATLRRTGHIEGAGPLTVVTGVDHVERVELAAAHTGTVLDQVIVEPTGRNTGPAVIAAALLADPDDILVVLPSDHIVTDVGGFATAVARAAALANDGNLVTFGIVPTRPETGYGYLEKGEALGDGFRVATFNEKPDPDVAASYVEGAVHLWNSGMFVFKASALLDEARRLHPAMVERVSETLPGERSGQIRLRPDFAGVESISIDHAVMERTDRAALIPIEVGWSDLGSWQSLWEVMDKSPEGNAVHGDVVSVSVSDSLLYATSRRVAVAGVNGLVVVETPDAVLVLPLSESQLVRDLGDAGSTD